MHGWARKIAIIAGMALGSTVLTGLLVVPTASAGGGYGPGSNPGSYTVQVTLTGDGVGSGGDLGVPASGGGSTVSIPTPCGYQSAQTEQSIVAGYMQQANNDKAQAIKLARQSLNHELSIEGAGNLPVTKPWTDGIIANWGKSGTWYIANCNSDWNTFKTFAQGNLPVLSTNGTPPVPPNPVVRTPDLLRAAEAAMTLPKLQRVDLSPSTKTYVKLDTWVKAVEQGGAALTPGATTRSVTATARAAGGAMVASVTVVATYQQTTFQASGSQPCASGGAGYQAFAGSAPAACLVFTAAAPRVVVEGDSQWTATAQGAGQTAFGRRGIQGADMRGQGVVTVNEIQTLDR